MEQTSPQPTLLVFTLGERQESRRRRLLPASRQGLEQRLHRACLDTALTAGREAGYRLEVSAPADLDLGADVVLRRQRGEGFGARLQHAFEMALGHGGPVVVVGSDVPDLDASLLRRTRKLLEAAPRRVVVGPSPDGGFYLLATAEPLGNLLGDVRWRSRTTLATLKRALRRQGRELVLLPALADLDHRRDLERWLAGGAVSLDRSWGALRHELRSVLKALSQGFVRLVSPASQRSSERPTPLRGPPHASLSF